MATKRIIAVVGATGTQGGSVARAILQDTSGSFALRALTRKPKGETAQSLARQGAEVVYADVDDFDSLKRAFTGAYGAYCMTDFWGGQGDPERERIRGSTMAEAARCAGLQHVIWSTLEDTRRYVPLSDSRMPTLLGKYKVPHFDGKGEADEAFIRLNVPTTFFLTSFYWENFIRFPGMGLRASADGDSRARDADGRQEAPGDCRRRPWLVRARCLSADMQHGTNAWRRGGAPDVRGHRVEAGARAGPSGSLHGRRCGRLPHVGFSWRC